MQPTQNCPIKNELAPPLVTVIVTVFKRTHYLEAAISSVLQQTQPSLELIVTDDAGTEDARGICAKFKADPRLRYRSNGRTLGTPLNIAEAMREAKGKYVALLNDDDLFEPQMLERLVPCLEQNPNIVVAFSNYRVIDYCGNELFEATEGHLRMRGREKLSAGLVHQPFEFVIRDGLMVVMGCVFRRSSFKTDWLVPEVAGAYDYWLAIKMAWAGGGLYFLPEALMRYRVHQDSESTRIWPERFASQVFIYESLSRLPLAGAVEDFVRTKLARTLYKLGRDRLLYGGKPAAARKAIVKSLAMEIRALGVAAWAISFLPPGVRLAVMNLWLDVRRKIAAKRLRRTIRGNLTSKTM